ncbi:MAG: SGNH/GDSL hydrolase family protein [Myxococcota bacterium]
MLPLLLAACQTAPPPAVSLPDLSLSQRCFGVLGDPDEGAVPDYEPLGPVVPEDCVGTGHQDIGDLDRVVFLGDSITTGTFPTPDAGFYRNLLVAGLEEDLGHPLETQDCSRWGARVDDLQRDDTQIVDCIGADGTDERATLVVFTIGGNDMFAYAQDLLAGGTLEQVDADVDDTIALFDQALDTLVAARARFPNGLYVVFANLYEYTDGTGDLSVCPAASLLGFDGVVPEMRSEYVRINEAWVAGAVRTQFDVVFALEAFCGHGFLAGDPDNECFRGEDAETWFDGTCIHPNEEGHRQLAAMFRTVVGR